MGEHEAAMTSMHEFRLRLRGSEKAQMKHWEDMRWLVWQNLLQSPYVRQLEKPQTPEQYIMFPWEEEKFKREMAEKKKTYSVGDNESQALESLMQDYHNRIKS